MSLLEISSVLYSSIANTGLTTRVLDTTLRIKDKVLNNSQEIDTNLPGYVIKRAEALSILDEIFEEIENKEYSKDSFFDLEDLIDQEKAGDKELNEEEVQILRKYRTALELLKQAIDLGDTYAICIYALLSEYEGSLMTIRSIKDKTIQEQESLNWFTIVASGTIGEHQNNIYRFQAEIQEAADKGDKYAQYHIGRILKKHGDSKRGVLYFKESFLQGNMDAAYELARHYYEGGNENYRQYLEPALKAFHADSYNLQGEIFWRAGNKTKGLLCFQLGAKHLHHRESFINYMLLNPNAVERDDFFGETIEKRAENGGIMEYYTQQNKGELLSYEPQYVKDQNKVYKELYTGILQDICKRLGVVLDVELDIDEVLDNLYFQRRLNPNHNQNTLGLYHPISGNIGIDAFLHLEGTIKRDNRVRFMVSQVLCHEIIHKISRESGPSFSLPRFLDEGITTSIEEKLMQADSFAYPQERRIFEKLIEYSGIDRNKIFENFLKGNSWFIKSLLDKHLNQIMAFFSNEEDFGNIVTEMESYQKEKIAV